MNKPNVPECAKKLFKGKILLAKKGFRIDNWSDNETTKLTGLTLNEARNKVIRDGGVVFDADGKTIDELKKKFSE